MLVLLCFWNALDSLLGSMRTTVPLGGDTEMGLLPLQFSLSLLTVLPVLQHEGPLSCALPCQLGTPLLFTHTFNFCFHLFAFEAATP